MGLDGVSVFDGAGGLSDDISAVGALVPAWGLGASAGGGGASSSIFEGDAFIRIRVHVLQRLGV